MKQKESMPEFLDNYEEFSKIDWFASLALIGLLQNPNHSYNYKICKEAFDLAEEMYLESKKRAIEDY